MFSEKLIQRLKNAYTVTVLTGAGISAESGVPTFRGKDGLWNNYPVEQLATAEALENNPKLFWEFYNWRRNLISRIKPNLGHYALVDIENYFEEFTLITQNVDNLHTLAHHQPRCSAGRIESLRLPGTRAQRTARVCGALPAVQVVARHLGGERAGNSDGRRPAHAGLLEP